MSLENDQFLAELTKMFHKSRTQGSVAITMKRYDGRTKPIPRDADKHQQTSKQLQQMEYKCLFRAKLGSKKISTAVASKDVNKFQLAYANVLKSCMDNLRKRERKTEKERKEKKKDLPLSLTTKSTSGD